MSLGYHRRGAVGFYSKYCRESFIYPDPLERPSEFIDYMVSLCRERRFDLFIPMIDEVVYLVSRNLHRFLPYTRVPIADEEKMRIAFNKRLTLEFARAHGFSCPKTFFPEDLSQLADVRRELGFPVVIKPLEAAGAQGLLFVESENGLEEAYRRVHSKFPFPMVQEMIPPESTKYQVCCLFNSRSELRAAIVQRFHRQYPLRGGTGTCFESVENEEVMSFGVELMKALGWSGVACVELLIDSRDGLPKLMEINPRFWGTLQLCILAGMDIPYLLYRMAMEGDVEPQLTYKTGMICRWMLPGEILHFAANPARFRLRPSFFNFFGNNVGYCILDRDDPLPVLAFFWVGFKGLFDRKMLDFVFRRL